MTDSFEELKAGIKAKRRPKQENGEEAGEKKKAPPQAQVILKLASGAAFFHTPDGNAFADILVDGHRETWPIDTTEFRRYLRGLFFEATGSAPDPNALRSALGTLEAVAHFKGPERRVFTRIGSYGNKTYLDLCDAQWRAVEYDASGWRVVQDPPVRFRRKKDMAPLPEPQRGGSINELRPLLNLRKDGGEPSTLDKDFVLFVACLLGAVCHVGPYVVLSLAGEHGSAKSTIARIFRDIIDPHHSALRGLPRNDKDLFAAASSAHILGFNNVSGLQPWVSDLLCLISDGTSHGARKLYTDNDEFTVNACCPQVITGITDVIDRSDLADRTIFIILAHIPDEARRDDKEFYRAFEEARPRILGALLDAAVVGHRNLPTVRRSNLPRMAGFARWVIACEPALWPEGTFDAAYFGNIKEASTHIFEADQVAIAVHKFIARVDDAGAPVANEWEGTPTDLLTELENNVTDTVRKSKDWPSQPNVLSGRLRRAAPVLRENNITIGRGRDKKTREIQIKYDPVASSGESSSSSSSSSPSQGTGIDIVDASPSNRGAAGDDGVTMNCKRPSPIVTPSSSTEGQQKQRGSDGVTMGDAGDDEKRTPYMARKNGALCAGCGGGISAGGKVRGPAYYCGKCVAGGILGLE